MKTTKVKFPISLLKNRTLCFHFLVYLYFGVMFILAERVEQSSCVAAVSKWLGFAYEHSMNSRKFLFCVCVFYLMDSIFQFCQ